MAWDSLNGKQSKQFILRTNNSCDPNSLNCNNRVCCAFKSKMQNSKGCILPHKIKERIAGCMKAFLRALFLRISSKILGERRVSTKKMETYLFLLLFFLFFLS